MTMMLAMAVLIGICCAGEDLSQHGDDEPRHRPALPELVVLHWRCADG